MTAFLKRYGGRGLGEIDLGRTRWAEDPTHVFEMLSSFLQIEDESQAPDVVFARGAASAPGRRWTQLAAGGAPNPPRLAQGARWCASSPGGRAS